MNLKKQAALEVGKMLAVSSIGAAIAIAIISNVPLNILGPIVAAVVFVYCIYNLYKIRLSDLEYKAKLTEMTDKSSK